MLVLISYDVMTSDAGGRRRLRRVAKACQNYGKRVQLSVFECDVDPGRWVVLRAALLKEINVEKDSLRFYYLGSNWKHRVEHVGSKKPVDFDEPMII